MTTSNNNQMEESVSVPLSGRGATETLTPPIGASNTRQRKPNTSEGKRAEGKRAEGKKKRVDRPRTTLLRGNFQLYDSHENLKLFSEPNGGRKGAVFEASRQVMRPFPRVKDVKVSEGADPEVAAGFKLTDADVSSMVFTDHHEGALIRVYYAAGSWQISTQRKIDAFKSRWSGPTSFGQMWVTAIEEQVKCNSAFAARVSGNTGNVLSSFFKTLDTNCQYLFVVRHNEENRIVCDAPDSPMLYHVGTFSNGSILRVDNSANPPAADRRQTLDLPTPRVYTFPTFASLQTHVRGLDSTQVSGCLGRTKDNKWYKFQNDTYLRKEKIRGNEPSLRFRYIQVRLDGATVEDLYQLFPTQASVFDECEDNLYAIAKYIHKAYMDRFIRRQFVQLEREFFSVMRICHEWHKMDRQYNKVDLDKVIEVLNTRYDHVLNKMIRMFKKITRDESEKGEIN